MDIIITIDSKDELTGKERMRIMRVANMLRANEDRVKIVWQTVEELEPLHLEQ